MPLFSEAQWRDYEEDGFLPLGRVLADPQALAARMEDVMLGRVLYPGMVMQLDGGGAYEDMPEQTKGFKGARLDYRKIQDLEQDPLFRLYLETPLFREACDRVYGPGSRISIYRAMYMGKPAQAGTDLPWHQDGGETWNVSPDPLLTSWTALTPSTKDSGCVQVVRGSHKLGLLSKKGNIISKEMARRHCKESLVVDLEAQPGEAFLLHNFLIHRSGFNSTSLPRMAFSVCYMPASTRHKLYGNGYPEVFKRAEPTQTKG